MNDVSPSLKNLQASGKDFSEYGKFTVLTNLYILLVYLAGRHRRGSDSGSGGKSS